jgi:DNA-binding NtrC family response regulator
VKTPFAVLAILGDAGAFGSVIEWIRRRGIAVSIATSGAEGLRLHDEASADLVLVGLPLPDMRAASLVASLHRQDPHARVIVVGIDADVTSQLAALELGASEYVLDPIDGRRDLLFALGISLGMRKGDSQLRLLRAKDMAAAEWKHVVAGAPEMKHAVARLRAVCEKPAARAVPAVLLTGELGTGKGLLARALHYNGPRRSRAFVEVPCGLVPEREIMTLLFGEEARHSRPGLCELVDGGTVFLDEVGALGPDAQAQLLAAIEDRQITRLGGTEPIRVDVQVVAATRRDLGAMVKRGELRADLYHRLNVISVEVPPLRERGDDVVAIAHALIAELAAECGIAPPRLAEDAMAALRTNRWPGNLRELRNELERIVLLVDDDTIRADHFRAPVRAPVLAIDPTAQGVAVTVGGDRCPLEQIERELIRQALVRCGNVSAAARYLDLTRQTLLYRMKKYGFATPSHPGLATDEDM